MKETILIEYNNGKKSQTIGTQGQQRGFVTFDA